MNYNMRVIPHGRNDIGFRVPQGNMLAHYYMSHQRAGVAITHCGLIAPKQLLQVTSSDAKCQYCKMIEELRDGLDSPEQKGRSIDDNPTSEV